MGSGSSKPRESPKRVKEQGKDLKPVDNREDSNQNQTDPVKQDNEIKQSNGKLTTKNGPKAAVEQQKMSGKEKPNTTSAQSATPSSASKLLPRAKARDSKDVHKKPEIHKEQATNKSDQHNDSLTFPMLQKKVMQGDMMVKCPTEASVVRIFVSSTFTDTRHERNWLMERVYPKLKTFCRNHGYDFQVVDMRWGIRDEAQDDHMTTDICLKEVQLCKEKSTGPYFVSLMSHKYGYRDFPRSIAADEFEKLLSGVQDVEAQEMLQRWFQLDENSVPPTYVLQPISTQLPDTKSDVAELNKEAWISWTNQNARMHTALAQSAKVTLAQSKHNAYVQSVSEAEVGKGLEGSKTVTKERLVWFRRVIKDIDQVDPQKEYDILRRYKDTTGEAAKDEESQELLRKLEDGTLKANIPSDNVFNYEVNWQTKEGISPDSNRSHNEYLTKLCQDAEEHLKTLCERAFAERALINSRDQLFQEALHHVTFCQRKCESFQGRGDSLKLIEAYLRGSATHPLVIYGPSGCGKTSLVAMAAKLCHKIFSGKSVNIVRFIGTTPDSTTLPALLSSVIHQLQRAAMISNKSLSATSTVTAMFRQFCSVLEEVAKTFPIVLLFDSLDQLDPSHDARQIEWLPTKLPANVKVIVSTLPDTQCEALPALRAKYMDVSGSIMKVPELTKSDITKILDQWLTDAGRKLTQAQRSKVLNAFQQCSLPLFLRLSFDEARKWKSYTKPELTILQPTIRDCINQFFTQMETTHGKVFVSRALGYLTTSEIGLSEAELEDILSCDNEVLGDVYRFWTPPVRRLPPLLLVRMKRDLGDYVVNRAADSKQVFFWYHRQFIEAARERYCNDPETVKGFHDGLAHFFAGTWGDGKPKPYHDNKGREMSANRHVASQPLKLGNEFNTRKLANLARHRNKSHNLALLKSECLLNFEFLRAKIECLGVRSLLDDFHDARLTFPNDLALEGVGEALQLSQSALTYDVRLLPTQLLGRIRSKRICSLPEVAALLAHCESPGGMYLVPDRPVLEAAGGILVHSIGEHADSISAMVVNRAGTVAVTCDEEGVVKICNIWAGKVLRTINGLNDATRLVLACDESTLIANPENKLVAHDLTTGTKKWSVDFPSRDSQFILGGPKFSRVLIICSRTLTFLDANTGTQLGEASELPEDIPNTVKFDAMVPAVGSERYMVTVESSQKSVLVFDAVDLKLFLHKKVLKRDQEENSERLYASVDGLAISDDGKTLYMANCMNNDLHLVDTATLEVIKSYQGIESDYSNKLHVTNDGNYVYFSNSGYVRVWELSTGKKATVLNEPHAQNIQDVYSPDLNTFITYHSDRTLKIWDLRRSDNPKVDFKDLERSHKSIAPESYLHDIFPLDSTGRYFLAKRSDDAQVLAIFDTSTQCYVYHGTWRYKDLDSRMYYFRLAGDWKISFKSSRRSHVLDLRTMKVSCVVQGLAPDERGECHLVNGGKELATMSRDRMNIKIVDIHMGKIVSILKGGQEKRMQALVTNKTGTKLAADCEGPILVFDVIKRCAAVKITPQMVKQTNPLSLSDAAISDDGVYLLFSAEAKIPQAKLEKGVKNMSITTIHVFDIAKENLAHLLSDAEEHNKIGKGLATDTTVSARCFYLLDDKRLVSTHDDAVVRVWDFTSGVLLQRLRGHISEVKVSVCPGSNILITNGCWDEEYTIRLWDTDTWECIAMYRYDYEVNDVQLLSANSCKLIGRLKTNMQPLMFTLKGQLPDNSQSKATNEVPAPSATTLKGNVDIDLSLPDDDTIDNESPD